jgi:DNA-binding Lrp family transcriptional regulator
MIDIRPGEIHEVIRQLRRIDGVAEANMTFGPYDSVAVIDANDVHHLGQILASQIQPIPGIVETLTCLAVDF